MMDTKNKGNELSNYSMGRLAKEFDDLATGRQQTPRGKIESEFEVEFNELETSIHNYLTLESGPLFKHFLASVPYSLEELVRIDRAIIEWAIFTKRSCKNPILYWECEAFDGSNARALSTIIPNRIKTLTTSPNPSNSSSFYHYCSVGSFWQNISFYDLNKQDLATLYESTFSAGFDFCLELAGLQFYGKKRASHIKHLKQNLNENGLLILLHKMSPSGDQEYQIRENVKDTIFKSRYFTDEEILWKRERMLNEMETGLISLNETISICKREFGFVALTWNSSNFFEIICCDNKYKLEFFSEAQGKINIDSRFQFETSLPQFY